MTSHVEYLPAYIRANIGGIANAEQLARQLGLPYETLRKVFRRHTGQTLGRFIEQVRIEEAKRLLLETDLLCFEVAYRAGYDREDVAMRAFKRNTGMSMKTWRAQFRSCRRESDSTTYQNCQP